MPPGPRVSGFPPIAGRSARVLVLGSVHLAQEEGGPVTADAIEPLLQRLARFDPQVITVESMPGETCDMMRRHPASRSASTTYEPRNPPPPVTHTDRLSQ